MDEYRAVFDIIEHARAFGSRELANGTRLVGHVPHIAPEAWFHEVFTPLTEADVVGLERRLPSPFPSEFRQFLGISNGINLYSVSLAVYGRRTSYERTGDEVWQPFCITTANTFDRPRHARDWQLIVGSYKNDGSLISLDVRDGTAFRTKARSSKIQNRWNDFREMLTNEVFRLAGLFDATGHDLTNGATAPQSDVETR